MTVLKGMFGLLWLVIVGMFYGLLGLGALIAIWLFISVSSRNSKLDTWARSIPLTFSQQDVMWELWCDFKAGRVPDRDPLGLLSESDRAYIKTICSAPFRPSQFGNADVVRLSQFISLCERGWSTTHAAIIVGMTQNRVGRKDLWSKN